LRHDLHPGSNAGRASADPHQTKIAVLKCFKNSANQFLRLFFGVPSMRFPAEDVLPSDPMKANTRFRQTVAVTIVKDVETRQSVLN
jgi:hypothetical protein